MYFSVIEPSLFDTFINLLDPIIPTFNVGDKIEAVYGGTDRGKPQASEGEKSLKVDDGGNEIQPASLGLAGARRPLVPVGVPYPIVRRAVREKGKRKAKREAGTF